MMVECFCGCRNKIEQSCAYKIVLGGTRKVYFLNEQHYLRWQDKNSAKSNKIDEKEFTPIYDAVLDICGGKFTGRTIVWKEYLTWKEAVDGNGNKVKWYLTENKRSLSETLKKKHFESDFGMIKYLSAIVKSNVAQYRSNESTVVKPKEDINITERKTNIPNFGVRKSLSELEDEFSDKFK